MRLIDADALRKHFVVPHELKCGIQAGMDEYAIRCIDEQPTIDAVPVRHGEWIEKDEDFQAYLECSNCNMVFPVTVGWSFMAKTNFCPNCGARMNGKEET